MDDDLLPFCGRLDAAAFPAVVFLPAAPVLPAADFVTLLFPLPATLLAAGFVVVPADDDAARPLLTVFTALDAALDAAFGVPVADAFLVDFPEATLLSVLFFAAALAAVFFAAVVFAAVFFAAPAVALEAACLVVPAVLPLLPAVVLRAVFARLTAAPAFDAAAPFLPVFPPAAVRPLFVPFAFAVLRVDFAISFTIWLIPLWLGGRLL